MKNIFPEKKMSKKVLNWLKARERLLKIYKEKGISACEIKQGGCLGEWTIALAHRYSRSDPRCRHTFKQTVLACSRCHLKMHANEISTEEVFKKLRPPSIYIGKLLQA